ncbi:MAG: LytTR family transcriptional regulator [Xanthomonadales bacterium]|nr:LytTR family transcriptional regulator [Xanthomonadales bacterium]
MNASQATDTAGLVVKRAHPRAQLAVLLFIMVVALISSHYQVYQPNPVWMASKVETAPRSAHQSRADALSESQSWTQASIADIGVVEGIAVIRMMVALPAGTGPIPPYALFLAGPFSAEAYWDGTRLGNKGHVGASRAEEIPGPIDAVIHIPESLSQPGEHELVLVVSSQNIGYRAQELFHNLYISRYQHDPRRQLRFYALPLVLCGCLVLFALHFARVYASSGSRSALLLSLMSALLLVQMALEVSRSLVAYPYDWHLFRSAGIWICAFSLGLVLTRLSLHRLGRESPGWVLLVASIALVASYFVNGFDNKTACALLVGATLPLWVGLASWRSRNMDLLLALGTALAASWLVSAMISVTTLLDRSVYFTTVAYLGLTWLWTSQGRETLDSKSNPENRPSHFVVKHTGRTERINADSVIMIAAAGNFAELVCADGRTILHHLRLGQIMENPPVNFVRVHRSFAVNLDKVRSLKSHEGSRYSAALENGREIPVSRYQVARLRERLSAS